LGDATYTLPSTTGGGTETTGGGGIKVSSNGVHIIGTGNTILQATRDWANGTWSAIWAAGVDGFEARGLDVRVTTIGPDPGGPQGIDGIVVRGFPTTHTPASTNFRIENNRVWVRAGVPLTNVANQKLGGIWIYSQHAALRATGGIIKGNILDDSHGRGIYLYRAHQVVILGNVVRNLGSTLTLATELARGIRIIGSTSISVVGNTIMSHGSAGYLRAISVEGDTANSDITVNGNTVYFDGIHDSSIGLWLENANYISVTGNNFTFAGTSANPFTGVYFWTNAGALPVTQINFSSNVVRGWTTYQIILPEVNPSDILISNNLIGKTNLGAASYQQINVGATRVRYVDNIEGDTVSPVTRLQPPYFAPGLLVGTGAIPPPLATRLSRFIESYTSPAATVYGVEAETTYNEATAPNANPMAAASGSAHVAATNTQNLTSTTGMSGARGAFSMATGAAGTVTAAQGFLADSAFIADGTVTNYAGFRTRVPTLAGGGAITNLRSFKGDAGAGIAEIADGIKTAKTIISGVNTVTFSATPTFDASLGNTQKITLTDNVTSSTLSNATAGQSINFLICQDATGSRTFVWPTNVLGGMTIGATLSKCSAQNFIFDGTNAYALSAGVTNI
jgi:hypothetical protein